MKVIIYIVFSILLVGCKTYRFDLDEQKKKTLYVYPIAMSDLRIKNKNVNLGLGNKLSTTTQYEIIQKKMHELQMKTAADYGNVIPSKFAKNDYKLFDQYKLRKNHLIIDNDITKDLPKRIKIPSTEYLNKMGVNADVVLIFSDYTIEFTKQSIPLSFSVFSDGSITLGVSGSENEKIKFSAEFIIWDNNKNELIKMGYCAIKSSNALEQIDDSVLEEITEKMFYKIFKNLPSLK